MYKNDYAMLKIYRNTWPDSYTERSTDQGQRSYTSFLGCLQRSVTFWLQPPLLLTPFANIKEAWILYRGRWLFGTIVHHLLSLLAFQIKLLSLPQHLASQLTGLLCSEQELGLHYRNTRNMQINSFYLCSITYKQYHIFIFMLLLIKILIHF